MMKTMSIAAGLVLVLAVAPAEAKHQNKIKTVVGCIKGSQNHYQLSTTTKKGKPKVYGLVGNRDFHNEVGHKVEARGAVSQESFKVTTLKSLGSSCR
jgi:hypothetical protein